MNSSQAKREKMLSLVEAWRTSGQTQKQFCTQVGIKIATLSYWIARSKDTDSLSGSSGNFIPLSPSGATLPRSTPTTTQIEIIYPNGVCLKLENNLSLIAQLIHLY